MYGMAKYKEGLVCPLVWQSEHHMKKHLMPLLKNLFHISLQETDILVNSYMVSLLTEVPVKDTSQLLTQDLGPHQTGSCHEITPYPCNGQLLHGIFWTAGHKRDGQEAGILIPIYR
jgi:hypothetical protein